MLKSKSFVNVGGVVIIATVLTLAIKGTIFGANFVGVTSKNVNPSFIVDQTAYMTPIGTLDTECTATGGLVTYDTCYIPSPFSTATAADRGLRVGKGVVTYLQLDIITNPNGVNVDCSVVSGANTATGGTVLFADITASGSVNIYSTPFVLGPTEAIKCGTTDSNVAGLDIRLKGIMIDSDVTS